MPTLTVTDLRDPAPPVPGPAHRAAVAARAKQLSRRRRFAQIGGACAVVAVLATGGLAIATSSSSDQPGRVIAAQLASVRGSTTETPVSTLTVTLIGEDTTVDVQADADGNFTVSDLPPGEYRIEWKYETSGTPPSDGVDIGTALSVGHITVNLSSGTNTVSIPLTK